jgi:hypothetical protein
VRDKGSPFPEAWAGIEEECASRGEAGNVESILSRVRMKLDAVGTDERLSGLDIRQLRDLEGSIQRTIAACVAPREDAIPPLLPHDQFANWVKAVNRTEPLEIFTTNYDILLERSFENVRIPVFDGFAGAFRPFFYPECIEDDTLLPGPAWVRLWKLHGSVNWRLLGTERSKRVVRGEVSETGEMILPSHRKYDESRKQPYRSFMDRLMRVLSREHALLITCGYSYGDDHINAIIYGALDSRVSVNVIALQFPRLEKASGLVNAARERSGLTLIGPNAGVIGGQWGAWRLERAMDKRTGAFMATAFAHASSAGAEGAEATEAAEAKTLTGTMQLGDFNCFCRFLSEMGITAHGAKSA